MGQVLEREGSMTSWKPIAGAPLEAGRPLLLYPHPFSRGHVAKREVIEAVDQRSRQSAGPMLDLNDPALRRMIRIAKKRGYVAHDDLDRVLPAALSREQIDDVVHQLSEMGIDVVRAVRTQDDTRPGDLLRETDTDEQADVLASPWAVSGRVFEGYWDGTRWRSAAGTPCEPTHWMPLPSPPLALVRS
jgi:Sigma-70 factor, region 1.1/Protein of unknown function (DUF551)